MKLNYRVVLTAVLLFATALGAAAGGCSRKKKAGPMGSLSNKEARKLAQARDEFERQKDPPVTADTRYAAGQLAESQGGSARAIAQYQEALRVDRRHVPSLYRLGVLYAKFRRYDQAIEAWQQYVEVTQHSAVGYSNLAFCYELAGDPAAAERAYLDGIARDSASGPCRVNYGLMLARNGRVNEAVLQLQTVLTPAEVHYNLASVFESQGRTDQARREYQKALELDPKFTDAQARLDLIE